MIKHKLFIIFTILLLLVFIAGCFSGLPINIPDELPSTEDSNQPPNAYIDLISPSEASPGELISFNGHGTDTDGTVVAYRWRSSIDGDLSTTASFDTTDLSEGNHIIYFKVQDNNDAWSEEVEEIVNIEATEIEPEELAILYFEADPEVFPSGDSSTLTWATTGALEVSIDQGIGIVDVEGSYEVSFGGEQTITYTLTASNETDTVTASVDVQSYLIMLEPDSYEVTLSAIVGESGYVRSNGQVTPNWIYAGDDNNNIPLQGFFSFDISGLPEDAMINSVIFDMSDHDTFLGAPLDDLDCLRVYVDDYGALDSSDYFTETPLGAIARYCSVGEIVAEENDYLKEALQSKVGESRLQLRLQFRYTTTDNDFNNDIVRWTASHLPKITIHYYSYEEPI